MGAGRGQQRRAQSVFNRNRGSREESDLKLLRRRIREQEVKVFVTAALLGVSLVAISDNGGQMASSRASEGVQVTQPSHQPGAGTIARSARNSSSTGGLTTKMSSLQTRMVFPQALTQFPRSFTAKIASNHKPKPRPKHHTPKPRPKHHTPVRHARTYVYQLGFPEGTTEASSCSTAPYTVTTNVGAVNARGQSLVGNGFPLTTIRFQPGRTLFKVTDAPGESGNAQFVQNICNFAAPNGDSANCAVRGTATYHTSTPVRNLAQLTSRSAYSITGVVDNVIGNFPCGNTPPQSGF